MLRRLLPSDNADHTNSRPTERAALYVPMTTGKMHANATRRIFDELPIPNQSMKMGRKAIFGAGKPSATNGSINHSAKRLRDMTSPQATPVAVPTSKPPKARARLSARSFVSDPSAIDRHNWSATTEKGGRNKGGVSFARAASSQTSKRSTTDVTGRQGINTDFCGIMAAFVRNLQPPTRAIATTGASPAA